MEKQLILFNGGLSTKAASHLIQPNEAIECINVNLEKGNLSPVFKSNYQEDVDGVHLSYRQADEYFITSQVLADDRFYVEYGSNTYWSDKNYTTDGIKKYVKGSSDSVGVNADAPIAPSVPLVITTPVSGLLSGDYTYCYTYVDSDGIEGLPSTFVDTATITDKTVHIAFTTTDTPVDCAYIRFYRTGENNPTLNLVGEIIHTVDGAVSFDDNTRDIDVARIELTSFDNTPPPNDLDMLIENNGTFWGSVGDRIYFSRTGSPAFWGTLDFLTLDSECTGLGKIGNSIVAFTLTNMYRIDGWHRDNVSKTKLEYAQGCKNKRSVTSISNFLFWVSDNGICAYDGGQVTVITKNILSWSEFARVGDFTFHDFGESTFNSGLGFEITYATGFQDKYYGVYASGILVIDMSNGVKVSTLEEGDIQSLVYNPTDNALLFAKDNATQLELWNVGGDANKATATWTTTNFQDEGAGILKTYRKVWINGDIGTDNEITVFIDGIEVVRISNAKEFFLPAGSFGYMIQFTIKTNGEINSLTYDYGVM